MRDFNAEEFRQFLERGARKFESKKAFAKAIGVTPGRLSRVLKGEHSFEVLNCLRLAKLTGESASTVLRVAGKRDVADVIEELYGEAAPTLAPADRQVLDKWHALNMRQRQLLLEVIDDLGVTYSNHADDRPLRPDSPTDRSRSRGVQTPDGPATTARGGATRRGTLAPAAHSHTNAEADPTPVSRAQRARESKEAAAIDRLTRAAEQAEPVGRSAGAARAARQHAAAVGARASVRPSRAGKHSR